MALLVKHTINVSDSQILTSYLPKNICRSHIHGSGLTHFHEFCQNSGSHIRILQVPARPNKKI